jgi:DNA processing protein
VETAELSAWLRLSLAPGVGNETARKLLAAFGSAPAIFEQKAATLRQMGSDRVVDALLAEPELLGAQLQKTLAWLQGGEHRRILSLGDPDYPAALLDIEDPPSMLYLVGAGNPWATGANQPATLCLAMVGSPNPTPQGESNSRQFAKVFGQVGVCVVSGLAWA